MNYLYKIRNICVYAKNIILQDLAWCLYHDIYSSNNQNKINIYIGIHEYNQPLDDSQINIGMQTEHYLDYNGIKLWRFNRYILKRKQLQYDLIVELNSNNMQLYDSKLNNVLYGPYIFSSPYKYHSKDDNRNKSIFIGSMNQRRECLMDDIKSVEIIDNKYGEDLCNSLLNSTTLYNIHYQNAVYNEWPRILLAYKYNMTLISEKLNSKYLINIRKINNLYEYKIDKKIESKNLSKILNKNIKKISTKPDKYHFQYHASNAYNYLRRRIDKYNLKPRHRIHPEHRIQ